MKEYFEQLKPDVKRLHAQGMVLLNAMRDEHFPAKIEEHFTNILMKDYK